MSGLNNILISKAIKVSLQFSRLFESSCHEFKTGVKYKYRSAGWPGCRIFLVLQSVVAPSIQFPSSSQTIPFSVLMSGTGPWALLASTQTRLCSTSQQGQWWTWPGPRPAFSSPSSSRPTQVRGSGLSLVSKIIIFNQHWECKGRQTGLCLSRTNHHLARADLLTFRFIQMQSGFQEISHKTCPLESHCYRYLLLQPSHGHRSQGH